MAFCNPRQMTAPEAYIGFGPEVSTADGDVTDDRTRKFLTGFMAAFHDDVMRVLTVLPRQ